MTAYYNEIDSYAAEWLRELIREGLIAPGEVDERSIVDVYPSDLRGFTQVHMFAGIGVWSYALRRAGWPDDRRIWTGSCPCQPFSAAGKGAGFDDERHLWPAFHWLIEQCSPASVLGEQVASKDADAWIDLVQTDMEALGYAFGAVPFPSAGVGAPHIRDRLYWVANNARGGWRKERQNIGGQFIGDSAKGIATGSIDGRSNSRLADMPSERRDRRQDSAKPHGRFGAEASGSTGNVAHPEHHRREIRQSQRTGPGATVPPSLIVRLDNPHGGNPRSKREQCGREQRQQPENGRDVFGDGSGPTNGFWRDADWLACRDDKWRPVEPGTFPLAHGAPSRVGRLRAYGNAINAEAAKVFIEAFIEGGG